MKCYLLVALVGCFLFSCSLEKRRYTNGYYSHHSTKAHKVDERVQNNIANPADLNTNEINSFTAINNNEITLPRETSVLIKSNVPDTNECDVIQLKDNKEISCLVTEISSTEIRYKRCDNLTGPTIVISKADVFLITYKNGAVELINSKSEAPVKAPVTNQTPTNSNSNTPEIVTEKKTHPFAKNGFICMLAGYGFSLFGLFSPALFVFAFLLFIVAIVLSSIALVRINRDPKKFKGKKRAILTILLSVLGFIVAPVLAYLLGSLLVA
jgi:hypothetical protein